MCNNDKEAERTSLKYNKSKQNKKVKKRDEVFGLNFSEFYLSALTDIILEILRSKLLLQLPNIQF